MQNSATNRMGHGTKEAVAAIREITQSEELMRVTAPYFSLFYISPTPKPSGAPSRVYQGIEHVPGVLHAADAGDRPKLGVSPHRRWGKALPWFQPQPYNLLCDFRPTPHLL